MLVRKGHGLSIRHYMQRRLESFGSSLEPLSGHKLEISTDRTALVGVHKSVDAFESAIADPRIAKCTGAASD